MAFSLSSLFFALNGVFMGGFSYWRFLMYREDRSNEVNHHYFWASFFVSLGFLFYGLPALFAPSSNSFIIGLGGAVATIFNANGFGHFFLAAVSGRLDEKFFIIVEYLIKFAVIAVIVFLVVGPPASFLDEAGVVHWQLDIAEAGVTSLLLISAFTANIVILTKHFYRLKKISLINASAFIATFALAGLGGAYSYFGDKSSLLFVASAVLFLGITITFLATIRGLFKRTAAA